jgi:hypothetical protein
MDRNELERWLAAEENGEDDASDAAADDAFAQLFTALPKVEPRPAFIERTVTATWQWRARRRRLVALGWAAAIAIIVAGGAMAYFASPFAAVSLIKGFAFVSGRALPWLVAYAKVALDWWSTLGHVGSVVTASLMTPARVTAILGVELIGILAFFALQRIAGAERFGDAQV